MKFELWLEKFKSVVGQPEDKIDLARAALLIATDEYPDLEIEEWVGRLDDLARGALPFVILAAEPASQITRLSHFLHHEIGLRGNHDEFFCCRHFARIAARGARQRVVQTQRRHAAIRARAIQQREQLAFKVNRVRDGRRGDRRYGWVTTVIVTCAVRTLEPQVAVIVYVVVVAGLTVVLPGVATPPMPLSISALSAPITLPQLKIDDWPGLIVAGDALNDSMTGVKGQGLGVGPATLISTFNVVPKNTPLLLRNRHSPRCLPGVAGAVSATNRSAVAPGAVAGTAINLTVVISAPATKTSSSPTPHVHVPVFRTRQILLNV